jgi:cysteine-rich repeat protein
VVFDVDGELQVNAPVDAGGGSGDLGGDVTFLVDGSLTIAPGVVVQVNGGAAAGEILSLSSPGALVVAGTLAAHGNNGGRGGTIDLGPHCRATVSGALDARGSGAGSGGDNAIEAGAISITETGVMRATPCQTAGCGNRLTLAAGEPSIAPGATVDPAATVASSPDTLPCCGDGALDPGEVCDDGNRAYCDGCDRACAVEPQPACPGGGTPCVSTHCDPDAGCITTPLTNTPCPDDGMHCTTDVCVAGVCHHPTLTCDDGIACTLDACNPASGCVASPQDALCDDGNPCTVDRCDPADGCRHADLPDGSVCDDASVCTQGERCLAGSCVPDGPALVCDDADPCTVDTCNPTLGCMNDEDPQRCPCGGPGGPWPAGTACADGYGCTVGDACDGAGVCRAGAPRSCDDADACTTDLCANGTCLHLDDDCPQSCSGQADGTPCSDGQACTLGACQGGECTNTPHPCDDGDPCTGREFCAQLVGCRTSFPADGVACSDGDACSAGDTCSAGTCVGGAASPCDACETCDTELGCHAAPRASCRRSESPTKSTLLVRDGSPDTSDLLVWKWLKGDAPLAAFGDPLVSDATLCVFDASQALMLRATMPAGGSCGTAACWKALGPNGFRYKDSQRTPDGIDKLLLRAGAGTRGKVVLKAKGDRLRPPTPPFGLPVVVQLQGPGDECFETRHDAGGVVRNEPGEFKGHGGPRRIDRDS